MLMTLRKNMEMLKFLTIVGKLKSTDRSGWVKKKVPSPESVSDHMYRMSIMAMVLGDSLGHIKKDHCIKMCLVHDMAESIVGDITPHDGISNKEKHRREVEAMNYLCGLVDEKVGKEMKDLFMEYENQETQEAKFVKDLDKFEMILQAHNYEQEMDKPGSLQEFFDSVKGKLVTSVVQDLADNLDKERNKS